MRNVVIAIFILCGLSAGAQGIYTPVRPTTYGVHQNRDKVDSARHIPEKDSLRISTIDSAAQIFMNLADSSIWIFSRYTGYKRLGWTNESFIDGPTVPDGTYTGFLLSPYSDTTIYVGPGTAWWDNIPHNFSGDTVKVRANTGETFAVIHTVGYDYDSNDIFYIRGTPADPALPPGVGDRQIDVSPVFFAPDAIAPTFPTPDIIWDEGSESTVVTSNVTVNNAYTVDKFHGTNSQRFTAMSNNGYWYYQKPSGYWKKSGFQLVGNIKFLSQLNRNLTVRLYNNNTPVGTVALNLNTRGVNYALLNVWQQWSIDLSLFTNVADSFNRVRVTVTNRNGGGGTVNTLMDYVRHVPIEQVNQPEPVDLNDWFLRNDSVFIKYNNGQIVYKGYLIDSSRLIRLDTTGMNRADSLCLIWRGGRIVGLKDCGSGGDGGWPLTGSASLTGSVDMNMDGNYFKFSDGLDILKIDENEMTVTYTDIGDNKQTFIYQNASGVSLGLYDITNDLYNSIGFDNNGGLITLATGKTFEYAADYSPFSGRQIPDAAWVSNNFWPLGGAGTLTGDGVSIDATSRFFEMNGASSYYFATGSSSDQQTITQFSYIYAGMQFLGPELQTEVAAMYDKAIMNAASTSDFYHRIEVKDNSTTLSAGSNILNVYMPNIADGSSFDKQLMYNSSTGQLGYGDGGWPLTGSASLTGSVTMDLDGNTLSFNGGAGFTIDNDGGNNVMNFSATEYLLRRTDGTVGVEYFQDKDQFYISPYNASISNSFAGNINGFVITLATGKYLVISSVEEHADNAAALTATLPVGALYRTGDALKIVH